SCPIHLSSLSFLSLSPPVSLLLPYTTLFRSDDVPFFVVGGIGLENLRDWMDAGAVGAGIGGALAKPIFTETDRERCIDTAREFRSEEHTSELQSRENLVCRLLLEKKKNSECR